MAKVVGQVRFYGEKDPRNFPKDLTLIEVQTGRCFTNYYPIVQLGVQTLPGTKMYLNKDSQPVIVGVTGVYELNIDGLSYINSLCFDRTSLQLIDNKDKDGNPITPNSAKYLIVDFISDQQDKGV